MREYNLTHVKDVGPHVIEAFDALHKAVDLVDYVNSKGEIDRIKMMSLSLALGPILVPHLEVILKMLDGAILDD